MNVVPVNLRQLLAELKAKGSSTAVAWAGVHEVADGTFVPWKAERSYRCGYSWSRGGVSEHHGSRDVASDSLLLAATVAILPHSFGQISPNTMCFPHGFFSTVGV